MDCVSGVLGQSLQVVQRQQHDLVLRVQKLPSLGKGSLILSISIGFALIRFFSFGWFDILPYEYTFLIDFGRDQSVFLHDAMQFGHHVGVCDFWGESDFFEGLGVVNSDSLYELSDDGAVGGIFLVVVRYVECAVGFKDLFP